jgi:DNA-binding response OmpR family regulator
MEKRPLILVIDDEKDLVDMIAFQFKARGYDTATASNGLEGLDALDKISPDLIVLDINMPKMGGIEFYQRICGSDGKPNYPVLVLTARANMEQFFKDFDVDGFMAKPFEIDALIHEAEIIIKKKARQTVTVEHEKQHVLRTVYVVDDDVLSRESIALALLRAGYRVACADNGTAGLELLVLDVPTLAVVKLGLKDIAGDIVVLKAQHMAKTQSVRFLLYEKRDSRHLKAVRQQIGDKTGVVDLVEYETAEDVLHAVDAATQKDTVEKEEKDLESAG